MLVTLLQSELELCLKFSYKCAEEQQAIEFGQSDTAPRNNAEIGRDNLIGKIGEVAFASMVKQRYGIDLPLDFEYYPRGQWDGQDTVINKWKVDIKATRQGGKWMLIEWSKINFRQKDSDLPHMFVMASTKWDRKTDVPTGQVDLVGCASILRLKRGGENTLILRKGEKIPGTSTKLQADNYAVHFDHLEHDWDKILNYILTHTPPSLDSYPNPYTGKPLKVQR